MQLNLPKSILTQPTRNSILECQICSSKFGIIRREHLCKRCYRFVCEECSPYKTKVYRADMQQRDHRLCRICNTESEIIKKYVSTNGICWGCDSQIGKNWSKLACQYTERRQSKMSKMKSISSMKKVKKIQKYVNVEKLWQFLNYSFRELICRSIENNKQLNIKSQNYIQIYSDVSYQLSINLPSLIKKYPQQQQTNLLTIFIFCMVHCNQDSAIILSSALAELLNHAVFSIEEMSIYFQKLNYMQIDIFRMEKWITSESNRLLNAITLNYMSIQMSIQLIGLVLVRRDSSLIGKAVAYCVSLIKDHVLMHCDQAELVEVQLLRNHQGLGEEFKKYCRLFDDIKPTAQIEENKQILSYEGLQKLCVELQLKYKSQEQEIIQLKQLCESLKKDNQQLKKDKKSKKNKRKQKLNQKQKEEPMIKLAQEQEQKLSQKSEILTNTFDQGMKSQKQHSQQKSSLPELPHTKINIFNSLPSNQQNQELKKKLKEAEQLNVKMVRKIEQLTGLIMDRQQERTKALQLSDSELLQIYDSKKAHIGEECTIF